MNIRSPFSLRILVLGLSLSVLPIVAQEVQASTPPPNPEATPTAPASVAPPPSAAAKPTSIPVITAAESSEFWRLQTELMTAQLQWEHTPEYEVAKKDLATAKDSQKKAEDTAAGQAFKTAQGTAQSSADRLRQKCAVDQGNPKFLLDQDPATKAIRCVAPQPAKK